MKTFLIFFILLPFAVFAQWSVLRESENSDCYLTWLEDHEGQVFILKQIKDLDPSEQYLLVVDAAANKIGVEHGIPVNHVEMIGAERPFIGKRLQNYPATLHREAPGVSAEEHLPWKGFSVHQRFRKPGSWMEKKWGTLADHERGLTPEVIKHILIHPDLQKIAALDTFLGNSDRSNPNIFYEKISCCFCGIDMAASFGSPLAQVACNQMTSLDTWQKAQLEVYKATLKELYADVTPQQVDQLLDALAEQAGFYDCDYLNDSTVWQRAFYHKRMFRENYQHIPMLIER